MGVVLSRVGNSSRQRERRFGFGENGIIIALVILFKQVKSTKLDSLYNVRFPKPEFVRSKVSKIHALTHAQIFRGTI